VSRYQTGKTNLDFTGARDSEWQWYPLDHMQVCTSLQADNHANTPPLSFFTGRMPFLPPNQQRQSTEGSCLSTAFYINLMLCSLVVICNDMHTGARLQFVAARSVVSVSLCVPGAAKAAGPIEMPLGRQTLQGIRNYVLDGGARWRNLANTIERHVRKLYNKSRTNRSNRF